MNATVLAYGFEARELKPVKAVCARLGIRLRRVGPEEYARPVGALFGLMPRSVTGEAGDVLGRMLVLGHLTARQLDAFLSALGTARAPDSLKAVLTEQNASWSGPALYRELVKERSAAEG